MATALEKEKSKRNGPHLAGFPRKNSPESQALWAALKENAACSWDSGVSGPSSRLLRD